MENFLNPDKADLIRETFLVLFGIVLYMAVAFDRKFIANEFTNPSTTTTINGKGGGGGLESTKEYQQMMKEEAAVETKKDQ